MGAKNGIVENGLNKKGGTCSPTCSPQTLPQRAYIGVRCLSKIIGILCVLPNTGPEELPVLIQVHAESDKPGCAETG